jgi:hypothetical protein
MNESKPFYPIPMNADWEFIEKPEDIKDWSYPPGDVRRYGAIGDSQTDCVPAIEIASTVGGSDGTT